MFSFLISKKFVGKLVLITASILMVGGLLANSFAYNPITKFINSLTEKRSKKMNQPRIVIKKGKRTLKLFDGQELIKSYAIGLGSEPIGDKEKEGDGKTPEGEFYIHTKNPKSRYFLSLGISYPSIEDAERGIKNGLISEQEYSEIVKAIKEKKMPPQKTKLGGEIYIHGGSGESDRDIDWTAGCIALKNSEIQELFDSLDINTPVSILP